MTDEHGSGAHADSGTTPAARSGAGEDGDAMAGAGGRPQSTDSGADALEADQAAGGTGPSELAGSDPLRGRGGPPTEEGVTEGE